MRAHVAALHRYPVKSATGEQVDTLQLDALGVVGDRRWAVRTADGLLGSGKRTRRFAAVPGLLGVRAALRDGRVVLVFPGGDEGDVENPATAARLSAHLGQPVTLVEQDGESHLDDGPVSLLGTASVAAAGAELRSALEPERFRPNVLLATSRAFAEDDLVGRQLRLGEAVLSVTMTSPRCVMVDAATADLAAAPGVLRAVGRMNDAYLGVIADVVVPGTVRVGDTLEVS